MKNMKKIASMIMTVIMVFAMMTTAFADEVDKSIQGTITINNAIEDQTYKLYKLFDLTYAKDADGKATSYSYKLNSTWKDFFATENAKAYISVDVNGYITWVGDASVDRAAELAKLAYEWLGGQNNIQYVDSKTAADDGDLNVGETTTVVFDKLSLGYYLVDSSLGALCGLTTTSPTATIEEKNGAPTVNKQVKEDSTGDWSKGNTADIGQIVEFKSTVEVQAGAQNYIFHDKMSKGLEFVQVTSITHISPGKEEEHEVENEKNSHYIVNRNPSDGCTFQIEFTDTFCDKLAKNDKIHIYYTAKVTPNAIIAGDGNENNALIEYGNEVKSKWSTTKTYTYEVEIAKIDRDKNFVNGATFRIYDAATGGNEIFLKKVNDDTYCRDASSTSGDLIEVKNGVVKITGLDNGDYYLEEIDAPDGYNKLETRQKFTVSDTNIPITYGEDKKPADGIRVINQKGSMLPDTGGMGTTLLYIAGGALVLLAVVLLITKKRMGNAE